MSEVVGRRGLIFVGNMPQGVTGTRPPSYEISVELGKRGWQVTITSSKRIQFLRLLDMSWSVWKHRKRYTIALIDVFSGRAFIWSEVVCLILFLLKKQYVLTLHGGGLPEFGARYPKRVKRLTKHAIAVTAPSAFLQDKMQDFRSDIVRIPNPIDLNEFVPRVRDHAEPRLIWVRAFHHIYQPALAPYVVALLCDVFPQVRLTMIGRDKGDGSLDAARKVAHNIGVAQHIEFVGAVEKSTVAHWLSGADIFINTTRVDNAPASVVEAMAAGLCVVSTDVGGLPYLIQNERNGLLVSCDDAPAMAEAVRRILVTPQLACTLSRNAIRTASRFSVDLVAGMWESLLEDAAMSS